LREPSVERQTVSSTAHLNVNSSILLGREKVLSSKDSPCDKPSKMLSLHKLL